ncbi:MAG: pyridoxal phosphate-dependent aminotransferase [Armatimonadetes bacterium]|nr:pyridoxal phosphate-dependent aminotransferase [Armatimonadota bacterium]
MKALSLTRAGVALPVADKGHYEDLVDLSSDYSHYTVPKPVAEAVVHAAQSTDLGRATAAQGRALVDGIVGKLQQCNALEVDHDSVVVTAGGTMGISVALAAVADAGDELLVPDPGWPGFAQLARAWGLTPVRYPIGWDGRIDYPALGQLVTPRTKLIALSQPSNPTGAVLDLPALRELVGFAQAHDLYVLSDETFDLIRLPDSLARGPGCCDSDGRVISVFSFAKTHALAGLRLGYVVAAAPLARAIARTQEALMNTPSSLAIAAGMAALAMDSSVVESMREFYNQQRQTLQILLPPEVLPYPPAGGFLALLDISRTSLPTGDAFAEALLQTHHLRVAPGSWFGERAAQAVRISFALKERPFGQAMARLGDFLEERGS